MTRFLTISLLLLLPGVSLADFVIDLPESSNKWHLTAVYSSKDTPTESDKRLMDILKTDQSLVDLAKQVIFTEWDNSTEFIQKSNWKNYLGTNRPALLLQGPATEDGTSGVVYFASGPHLKTDQNLARSLMIAVESHRTYGLDCPRCPKPAPVYPDTPDPPSIPITIPDVDQHEPVDDEDEMPLLLIVLIPLLGAGFGLFQSLRKESQG